FGGSQPRLFLFLFDLGGFFFELVLRGFHFLVAGVGIDHQFEDLVLVGRDFLFGELDLVQQGFVLLVGFYVERLVAVLGDFAAELGNVGVVLAAGGFIGLDGSVSLIEL